MGEGGLRRLRSPRVVRAMLALGLYLLIAAVWWWPLIRHLRTRTLHGGTADPGLFLWWIRWAQFAVAHGHDPLVSHWLQQPLGVAAIWNTSVLGLGVPLAPVTAWLGPIAAFNIAMLLGPPLTAWSTFLWLRRHVPDPAASVGGLVAGWSSFESSQSLLHPHMSFLALVPLLLMSLEDVLWRRPTWRRGIVLGVLATWQLFISTEVVLLVALFVVVSLLLLAARDPRQTRALLLGRLRVALPPAVVAVATALVLSAPALATLLDRRYRIVGLVQPLVYTGSPSMFVHAPPALLFSTGVRPPYLNSAEDGMYVGWPLIVLVLLVVVFLVRRPDVQVAAGTGAVAVLCQLRHLSPLLFLEHHIAPLHDIVTSRAAIAMWVVIAYLVAVGLDAAWARVRALPHSAAVRTAAAATVAAVVLACLVPLTPHRLGARVWGVAAPSATPAFFTGSGLAAEIPRNATVLVAPMADSADTRAERWQSAAHLRFRLVGGFAARPQGAGRSFDPPQPALRQIFGLLSTSGRLRPDPDGATYAAARSELSASGATYVVVGPVPSRTAELVRRATVLLGRGPDLSTGGVEVWRLAA